MKKRCLSNSAWPALLALSAVCAACVYYIVACPLYNSDYVEDVFWAQASLRSGRILSDTFMYGYALPVGGNLFMLPFVALFGVGLPANRCGMILFFLVLLLAVRDFCRGFFERRTDRLWAAALLLLSLLTAAGEDLLVHILHYGIAFASTLGALGCLFRYEESEGRHGLPGLLVWTAWSAVNGILTLVFFLLPFLFAAVVTEAGEAPAAAGARKKMRTLRIALLLTVGIALLFHALFMRNVQESGYLTNRLDDPGQWLSNAARVPGLWFSLFHLNDSALSLPVRAVWAVLMAAATLAPILMLLSYRRLGRRERRLVLFQSSLTAGCLFLCVFIWPRNYSHALWPVQLLNFAALPVCALRCEPPVQLRRAAAAALLACALAVSIPVFRMDTRPARAELMSVLESQGLRYGFATFFQANALTAGSGEQLLVRSVTLDDKTLHGRYFQAERDWFEPQPCERFFLALRPQELDVLRTSHPALAALAERTEEADGLYILIYDSRYWETLIRPEELQIW